MDDTPLIQQNKVSRSFVSKTAALDILHNADLSIQQGETIAIMGASGIGKSTLLNIIGTLDKPDEGSLHFSGEDILGFKDEKLAAFRNKNIGFVFQFHHLLQGFTAVENVMLPGLISGKSKKTIEKYAVNMLERVELGARIEYRVEDLSGGEQQRVAIARALVMAPALLLADEPTGNLDQKNSHAVHQLLKELNQEMGMTIIVVTHNSDLAGLMDRRLTLKDGKIVSA